MRAFSDIYKYRNYILYSIKSSLKAEVSGSYLSFLWWILEPLCYMVVYSIIFGLIFKSGEQYFPAFLFIGNSIWTFFSRTVSNSVQLIRQNESIISRIYLPKHVLLVIEIGINAFKLMVNGVIVALMIVIFRIPLSFNVLYLPIVLILLLVFVFGISSILMHIGVYIQDMSKAIAILLNVLMYFSGIFYSVENRLPNPFGFIVNRINPLSFIISSFRNILLYQTPIDLMFTALWLLISAVLSAIGIGILYKNENNYVKII